MERCRVLLVDGSDRGGIATYTAALAAALRREGLEVAVAAPGSAADGSPALAPPSWGPDVERLGRGALYRRRLAELPGATSRLLGAVRAVRPDVIHFQTEILPRLDPLVFAALRRRAPVVVTAHDPVPHQGGVATLRRESRRWQAADAVVIHGREPQVLVESSAGSTPVFVVPVDLRLGGPPLGRREARSRLGLPEAPTALLLGQLRPYKGLDLLAGAWPLARSAVPGARLLVVGAAYGDGTGLGPLAARPGVEVREGFVPEEDLDAWVAAADVVLLPYHHGSHSGVLHRALAAGTPVLASPALAEEVHRTGAGQVHPLVPEAWGAAVAAALGPSPLPSPPPPRGTATARGTLAVYRAVLGARR